MENTAAQVLEQQIADIETAIEKNKTEVGDLFLKVQSRKLLSDLTLDNMSETFKELDKMPPLIAKHESYLTQLETLQKTKAEIERLETGLIAK